MEKIFTVGFNGDKATHILEATHINCSGVATDAQIDAFVESNFCHALWSKVIITFQQDSISTALLVALHLRLTERLANKKFCPILLISPLSLESVLRLGGQYSSMLLTSGLQFLSSPSDGEITSAINNLTPLDASRYKSQFLDKVLIHTSTGRHSIANQWGAKVFDEVAGTNALDGHYSFVDLTSSLYYKFIRAKTIALAGNVAVPIHRKIKAKSKRILFIADEANKGWALVLQAIFELDKQDDFVIINQTVSSYEDLTKENKEIINSHFDIYLLDLRLNGDNEEDYIDPSSLSGMAILKKIKERNKGNQVIMFTASNKAWTFKAMLDEGANGYYVKESPELSLPFSFSLEAFDNFRQVCEECLSNGYLRQVASNLNVIKKTVDTEDWPLPDEFYNGQPDTYPSNSLQMIFKEADIIFSLLNTKNENRFTHSMLMLVKMLEELNKIYFSHPQPNNYLTFKDGLGLGFTHKQLGWQSRDDTKEGIRLEIVNSSKNQVHNILDRSGYEDESLYLLVEDLFEKRNNYIHPKNAQSVVTKENVLEWSEGLKTIFAYINNHSIN